MNLLPDIVASVSLKFGGDCGPQPHCEPSHCEPQPCASVPDCPPPPPACEPVGCAPPHVDPHCQY